jgi:hypothetical protein
MAVLKHPLSLIIQRLQNLGIDLQTTEPAAFHSLHSASQQLQTPAEAVPVSFTATNIFPSPSAGNWPSTAEQISSENAPQLFGFDHDTASFDFTPDMLIAFTNLDSMPFAEI